MLEFPKLKSYLSVFPISDTTWGLRGGSDQVWKVKLRNEKAMEAFCGLLPYLTGKHSVEDIVETLGKKGIDRQPILAVLGYLARTRLIEDGGRKLDDETHQRYGGQISFFSRFATSGGSSFQLRLAESHVAVLVDGPLGWMMCRQLLSAGIGRVEARLGAGGLGDEPGWCRDGEVEGRLRMAEDPLDGSFEGNLVIVPQERHDHQQLRAVEEVARERGVPWMLLRALDADEGWVGPIFIPGETASLASLQARLQGNMPFFREERIFDRFLAESDDVAAAPAGGLMPFLELLGSLATTEVVKLLSQVRAPHLIGRFLTVDLWDWNIECHEVLRVPGLEPASASELTTFPWKAAGSDGSA